MSSQEPLDEPRRIAYLNALGIPLWMSNSSSPQADGDAPAPESPREEIPPQSETSSMPEADKQILQHMDMTALAAHVADCTACDLFKTRKQTVFGVGHHKADWLIIGEAPGADEDRQGEPFVGRAGQLLTQMLRAIGLAREEVFIANILKCRPPNNRDPRVEEVNACRGYLNRQIELLEPKIILALGRIAAQSLLQTSTPIGKMRGRLYHLERYNIPVVVTYHPAYLLRSPKEKSKVWEDLKFARQQALIGTQKEQ